MVDDFVELFSALDPKFIDSECFTLLVSESTRAALHELHWRNGEIVYDFPDAKFLGASIVTSNEMPDIPRPMFDRPVRVALVGNFVAYAAGDKDAIVALKCVSEDVR
jgi:predicted phage gp36 major capsid-like protein